MGSMTFYGVPVNKSIGTARLLLEESFPNVKWSILFDRDWILRVVLDRGEWADFRFHTEDRSGEVTAAYFHAPEPVSLQKKLHRHQPDPTETSFPVHVMNFGMEIPILYPEAVFTGIVRALKLFPMTAEKLR